MLIDFVCKLALCLQSFYEIISSYLSQYLVICFRFKYFFYLHDYWYFTKRFCCLWNSFVATQSSVFINNCFIPVFRYSYLIHCWASRLYLICLIEGDGRITIAQLPLCGTSTPWDWTFLYWWISCSFSLSSVVRSFNHLRLIIWLGIVF